MQNIGILPHSSGATAAPRSDHRAWSGVVSTFFFVWFFPNIWVWYKPVFSGVFVSEAMRGVIAYVEACLVFGVVRLSVRRGNHGNVHGIVREGRITAGLLGFCLVCWLAGLSSFTYCGCFVHAELWGCGFLVEGDQTGLWIAEGVSTSTLNPSVLEMDTVSPILSIMGVSAFFFFACFAWSAFVFPW